MCDDLLSDWFEGLCGIIKFIIDLVLTGALYLFILTCVVFMFRLLWAFMVFVWTGEM